jgi:hypothetical protein
MAWCILGLWVKEMASRCGGYLGHRQTTRGGPPAWGMGEKLTTSHRKKPSCYEMLHRGSELAGCCEHGNETSGSIKGGEFLD